ncbi:MAG: tetratricopeptide repeat protein [Steroidobacteraceae bacterium]
MKSSNLFTALSGAALIAAGLALTATVPTSAAEKPTVTRAFGRPLQAANKALHAGKYQEALQDLAKARALPKPSPYDTHIINELALYAYVKTHDYANAAKAMEATLNDGFTTSATAQNRVRELADIYYQLKNYAKAADFGNRAVKGGFADANTYTLVSQAYFLEGNYRQTARFTQSRIDDELKRGQTPRENQMQIVLNSCVKSSDKACINRALDQLVTYYPKPEYWRDILDSFYQSKQAESSDTDMLNIYRLASDVGALTMPSQYIEMAQLALEQGSPGDAEQVIEKGYGSNVFTDPHDRQHAARLLATAKKQAASDQASLPKLASEAATAATGEKDVAVGMAYLGYQKYDQAVTELSQGLAKGSVHNETQARLLLGIAQLKAGQRAVAIKTFQQVTGEMTLQRLAALWTLRARSPAGAVASR